MMIMDSMPIWAIFIATIVGLAIVIEVGHRLGSAIHKRSEGEKESPVFAISAATLGLLAFMLALTFGIATDRFGDRKALVRDEANAIGTAYLRADFLPEPDRSAAKELFREYIDDRIGTVLNQDLSKIKQMLSDSNQVQRKLWDMAVRHAYTDLNSDVSALYIESLNQVIDIHALRVTVGLQTRIPGGIWLVLYALIFFSMISMGYQTGIAGSRRSLATLIMALSFAMVLTLIVMLDRPQAGGIAVSQQPLINARAAMNPGSA